MRRSFILIFSVSLFISFSVFADDFLKEIEDFEKYKKGVKDDFQQYLEIVVQEFDKFKREVFKEWGDQLISDRYKWVEYSPDLKSRTIVDFEKNKITIQYRSDAPKEDKIVIKEKLKGILNESIKDAINNNKPIINIEKKMSQSKQAKTEELTDQKVIGDIVPADGKQLDKLVDAGNIQSSRDKNGGYVTTFTVNIKVSDKDKAKKFKDIVVRYATKYNLKTELIYAIIHTESYFNPLATSPAPAYGLMQIIPTQAGKDAARVLYGNPLILLPSFLYNPENNINVGTTYLDLMMSSYLRDIKNPESRFYVAIVGYNVGLRNVYRVFSNDGNPKNAFNKINQLSSDEVYDIINKQLSPRGGVEYLNKVLERMKIYKDL
ncbi:MAG: transglycosylase SLT domain-containing protein [Calditerrivibrio sp.]|nr:transglycosylase SLT domain-containing protein [Calditerrivibrio sp.]